MRLWVLLAVFILAGCLQPDSRPPPSPTPSTGLGNCGHSLCLADPNSQAARNVREAFGLRQITNDQEELSWLSLRNGLLAFSVARIDPQIDGYAVYAYDLATESLISVSADSDSHSYLPTSDGRRILFNLANTTYDGAALWSGSGWIPITTRPGGSGKAIGFDYPWVTFDSGFSEKSTEDGYWAYNIEDHRRVFLYHPYPRGRLPDGSYETIVGAEVHNGTAVYILDRSPADAANRTPVPYNATVYAVDLNTRQHAEFFMDGLSAYRFSYSGNYLAIESGQNAWSLELESGKFRQHNLPGERCGFPSSGGDWVAFFCSEMKGWDSSKVFLANPVTGKRIQLQGKEFTFSLITTDGESVVIKAGRNSLNLTEPFHQDLYWAPIAELKGT